LASIRFASMKAFCSAGPQNQFNVSFFPAGLSGVLRRFHCFQLRWLDRCLPQWGLAPDSLSESSVVTKCSLSTLIEQILFLIVLLTRFEWVVPGSPIYRWRYHKGGRAGPIPDRSVWLVARLYPYRHRFVELLHE